MNVYLCRLPPLRGLCLLHALRVLFHELPEQSLNVTEGLVNQRNFCVSSIETLPIQDADTPNILSQIQTMSLRSSSFFSSLALSSSTCFFSACFSLVDCANFWFAISSFW